MEKYIIKQIENLCRIPSPSGFTDEVVSYIVNEINKYKVSIKKTVKNSIIAELGGEGKPLVLAAHIDTLGAMVRSIKTNGRLRFTKIGGYPESYIILENCTIHTREGKEFSATFQLLDPAVHVNKKIYEAKFKENDVEIVIDEKVEDKESVKKLGISAGDFVSFDPRFLVTKSGFIKSRHLDDKASSAILLSIIKKIKEENIKLNRKVYILFTAYEEVGHGGASGIPDDVIEMISVDMGAVGDDLQTDELKVSICAKDSNGPYDYEVTNKLIKIAKENKLNYAVDIYPFYGSDVDVSLHAGYDIKHGLIGPGVSASHGYERTHKDGLSNTFELILKYITK